MAFARTIGHTTFRFPDLRDLLAKASPRRSGDELAGVAAGGEAERVAARMALADLPLARLLAEPVVPYDQDAVTRLVCDGHDAAAFAPGAALTLGGLRGWLLCGGAGGALRGFEVAGADGVFHPATARIVGETVEVSSPAVAAPVSVRYGWANVPDCNLFNAAGLPASPFRAGQQVVGLQDS